MTTHWSVVLAAGRKDTARAQDALAQLCRTYWYPLYAYIRRKGYAPEDAKDLTQSFFERLLEKKSLAGVTEAGGKFRSFLLTSLNRFLVDEWKRAAALKRGSGQTVPLEIETAERRYEIEPADPVTPEQIFERNWALALLETAVRKLRQEYQSKDQETLFEALKFALTGERSSVPYADLARQLQLTQAAVKLHVQRLRQRYRNQLRAEVANTVATAAEIEDELRYLFRVLSA